MPDMVDGIPNLPNCHFTEKPSIISNLQPMIIIDVNINHQ